MARDFSPSRAFLLVAACCTWPPSPARADMVREAAEGDIDWNRVRQLGERHRVTGLMHNALTQAGLPLPADIAEDIANRALECAGRDLALAAEAIRLHRLFGESGLGATFFKGATLGILAYGKLGLRESKDIDILVSDSDLAAAIAVLEQAGYRRSDPSEDTGERALRVWKTLRKDYLFVHRTDSYMVELHWRLFDNPYMTDKRFAMAAHRNVAVGGRAELPTFGEDDLYAYLCLHGALTGWMRLKWLADIAALVSGLPPGGLEKIHAAAVARNAGPASAQALLLCRRLLRTRIPPALLARLKDIPHIARLEREALWALTAGHERETPAQRPFGGMRINLGHFLLARGLRYRLAELRLVLVSPIDALMVPLPGALQFLYPLLRLPLWLRRRWARG